ncbi:D-2-hydroxyacid dehydrogenase [Peribacillus glennii]|uniref:D-2-hydroxyacid dehydrogenase n=1 Tax=Peribacillus glennii TaxID=2303991 RepID=A0A372LC06_9BACI|nr:D-2-hydroxyacid dehydrogenase [Peribacillus glennii]RFU63012.1 D-2-hydroxyacid dehydrogenase [Peribacillus glennii]
MKILSTLIPPNFLQADMHEKFPSHQFHYQKGLTIDDEGLIDTEVLITYGEDLTDAHIKKAKSLKWIMVMSAGLEKMPFEILAERNILVTNARGIHKIPMAEYTIGVLLQYEKQLKLLANNETLEIWDRRIGVGEVHQKTILILGAGAIGGEIARLAKAFNMKTLGVNRSGKDVESIDSIHGLAELLTILPQADYVVSVLPSTKETKGLLKAEHFTKMKDEAVFVNIGRGDLYDEETLLTALGKQEIAHAVLDVFRQEPLPGGHPFWSMENVTVTPHLSSKTKQYLPRSFEIFEHNFKEYIGGSEKYINVIDPKRGY